MTISELKAIIAPQGYVTIWTMDLSGIRDCAFLGACKSLPRGFDSAEVLSIEACEDDLELTVRAEDVELEEARQRQVDTEIENMLGWMNIRR